MQERLQKVLAEAGVASRRAAERLIESGRVSVNGETVTQMGVKVDPDKDKVQVDGRVVQVARERIYILLNKPRGYVSTVRDPEGRRTVLDLIGSIGLRLYPVGRLDMDTEGLLLLTNDGELTNALIHPRHEVPKTYLAEVEGSPSGSALNALATGVRLEEGRTAPADVKVVGHNERGGTTISLTIHEGRNRQVRRMLEAIGHPVYFLKRTRFGPLDLRGLKLGKFRYLTSAEVDSLKAAAGGARPARPQRWRGRSVAGETAGASAAGTNAAGGHARAKLPAGTKPALVGARPAVGRAAKPAATTGPRSLGKPGAGFGRQGDAAPHGDRAGAGFGRPAAGREGAARSSFGRSGAERGSFGRPTAPGKGRTGDGLPTFKRSGPRSNARPTEGLAPNKSKGSKRGNTHGK